MGLSTTTTTNRKGDSYTPLWFQARGLTLNILRTGNLVASQFRSGCVQNVATGTRDRSRCVRCVVISAGPFRMIEPHLPDRAIELYKRAADVYNVRVTFLFVFQIRPSSPVHVNVNQNVCLPITEHITDQKG